jgi:hypothetical protein
MSENNNNLMPRSYATVDDVPNFLRQQSWYQERIRQQQQLIEQQSISVLLQKSLSEASRRDAQ